MQVTVSYSRKKRFLWTHKENDLAPYLGIGLVLQVDRDAEKFLQVLGFESLHPFFQRQRTGSMFHSYGGYKRLAQLNLLAKLIVLLRQILFNLAIAAMAPAMLMRISAEQVPSVQRVAPRYLQLVISSYIWPFVLISALLLFVMIN